VGRFDGPAIIACHPPKSEPRADPATVMGSSTIVNKSQAVIQCIDGGGDKRKLRVLRIKGAQRGGYFHMILEPVSYVDGKGIQRSSVVPAIIASQDGHAAVEVMEREHARRREAHGEWIVQHMFGGLPGRETIRKIALKMDGQSHDAPDGSTITFRSEQSLRKPGASGLPTIFSEPYHSETGLVLTLVDDQTEGRMIVAETADEHDIRVADIEEIDSATLMSS
jgi:hypothetical protein